MRGLRDELLLLGAVALWIDMERDLDVNLYGFLSDIMAGIQMCSYQYA